MAVDDHSESLCSLHNFLDSCTNLGFSTQFLCSCCGFSTLCTYLLTYLGPSLPVEHRPSMTLLHRTWFWAVISASTQLIPCLLSSVSVSRLQLVLDRPLFRCPWGFQVRAWHVVRVAGFLKVWPIHPHFRLRICFSTGSCLPVCYSSSFLILFGHLIQKIHFRQLFMKV